VRAALTRREPAIRDFFDVDNAVQGGILDPLDEVFVELLQRKLSVTADPVNLSPAREAALQAQLVPELRPVLRQIDYDAFQLERVIDLLKQVAGRLPSG
jgi:hypothetical protein